MNPDTCCTLLFGYYSQIRKTVNTKNISGGMLLCCEKLDVRN